VSDDLLAWGAQADGRSTRGRTWKDPKPLLKITLLGILAGSKGPKQVEKLSKKLSKSVRRQMGIPRRIPDTTLRDFLTKLDPVRLQNMLWVVGYDAGRRKALRKREDIDIPFGVISADGKYPSISDTGSYKYLQVHHHDGEASYGLVRTVTCCLVTALGRPILGAVPILGSTNEKGGFAKAFGDMVRIYGRRFRLFMYDAGGASEHNADAVNTAGKEYLFLIADPRWQMYQTIELLLRDRAPDFVDEELVSESKRVVRKLTLLPVEARSDGLLWGHTRTIFRIDNEVYENGKLDSIYTRYSVTSLEANELAAEQWLKLHVIRWGAETAHSILDTTFEEDDRPWIRKNAQGNLAVQILRRVAFTLTALYKYVTVRNEDERREPWCQYLEWVEDMLKWATPDDLEGLRPRTYAVPPALA
jgi:hypothetical protein